MYSRVEIFSLYGWNLAGINHTYFCNQYVIYLLFKKAANESLNAFRRLVRLCIQERAKLIKTPRRY